MKNLESISLYEFVNCKGDKSSRDASLSLLVVAWWWWWAGEKMETSSENHSITEWQRWIDGCDTFFWLNVKLKGETGRRNNFKSLSSDGEMTRVRMDEWMTSYGLAQSSPESVKELLVLLVGNYLPWLNCCVQRTFQHSPVWNYCLRWVKQSLGRKKGTGDE